jgi:hypothetical protein
MDKTEKHVKAAIGQQTKLPNGSTLVVNEKKKLPEPRGRVVRKESTEKKAYTPVGKVVRRVTVPKRKG